MFGAYLEKTGLPLLKRSISFPAARDRAAWEGLLPAHRDAIAREYAARKDSPYPMLTAGQFMAFVRDGRRRVYEDPYFERRKKLIAAALYVCAFSDAAALPDVIDGLWCICEESFWGVSAHNGSAHPGTRPAREHPLPDTENPYIDLFAAQTGATLALILHLLQDELDAVTPQIARRVRLEIRRRVITPFFHHDDFWWMGMMPKAVNNWNPWILSNVLTTLTVCETDAFAFRDGVSRVMRMLDAYVAQMPSDGGCDEGVSYWNMAGGALLDCLETLYHLSDGRLDFYHEPLVQKIGAFPLKAHITADYFWNFADCDAKPVLDGERVYRYGLRTGNSGLMALGADMSRRHPEVFSRDTPEFSRVLNRLFNPINAMPALPPQMDVLLPDLQVMALRRGGLYGAIKAGHNDESHNHNDVGTFLIYQNGCPKVIDAGNMVYTAKTFGPERYTLFNTRGANHNLPVIGGHEQREGREHAATAVVFEKEAAQMDIAPAYPKEAGALKILRRFAYENNAFVLTDEIILQSEQSVTWVFMLREMPGISPGLLKLHGLLIAFDPALSCEITEIPVTDSRMAKNFPGSLFRAVFLAPPAQILKQTFIFTEDEGSA